MKIREFRHLDELNRLPKDYVQIDKHINDHPESFKKRLFAFILGIILITFIIVFVIMMFISLTHFI